MAHDQFIHQWLDDGELDTEVIQKYLMSIQDQFGAVTAFLISDHTMSYYHANGELTGVSSNEPNDDWYFRCRTMLHPYGINIDNDARNSNRTNIFVNHRVTSEDGSFIGLTGVGLAMNEVQAKLQSYKALYGGEVFILDPERNRIISQDSYDELPINSYLIGTIQQMELRKNETQSSTLIRDGRQIFVNCQYLPELG